MRNLRRRLDSLERQTTDGGSVLVFTQINSGDERDSVMEEHDRKVEKLKQEGKDVLSFIYDFSAR